ncbi:MAG: crossover junction endodeoxyribonuclease RuvC [Oscillospiraceae bacterium]|jgi:crossover junction endodeoxyribonuclease RuvC|nr:crossover junction endodeoxyribonuclease RuvC [Oscillospiraceae bacterium]
MKIVGIDPGYAIVGYGVVEYRNSAFTTLDYGAVLTPAGMPFQERLALIYDEITQLLDRHKPQAMAVEKLYFGNNKTTGIDVAQARGVILLSAQQHQTEVYEYTPVQVKQAVVGYGKAEKHQVMDMTRRLLKLTQMPKPDDTADALAIAVCHAHASPSRLTRQLFGR